MRMGHEGDKLRGLWCQHHRDYETQLLHGSNTNDNICTAESWGSTRSHGCQIELAI